FFLGFGRLLTDAHVQFWQFTSIKSGNRTWETYNEASVGSVGCSSGRCDEFIGLFGRSWRQAGLQGAAGCGHVQLERVLRRRPCWLGLAGRRYHAPGTAGPGLPAGNDFQVALRWSSCRRPDGRDLANRELGVWSGRRFLLDQR